MWASFCEGPYAAAESELAERRLLALGAALEAAAHPLKPPGRAKDNQWTSLGEIKRDGKNQDRSIELLLGCWYSDDVGLW